MSQPKTHKRFTVKYQITLLILFVCGLWLGSWFVLRYLFPNLDERSQVGDAFNAVGALFSGLAFGGLIITIILQSRELALQREELTQTREELKGQKEQLEEQNKTFKRQRFENTFFEMMRLLNDIINSIYITPLSPNWEAVRGRANFRILYDRLPERVNRGWEPNEAGETHLTYITLAGREFFREHQQDLEHYFGHLRNILEFISMSEVEDKKLYANVIRAQLSVSELGLIFYYCIAGVQGAKLGKLVREFNTLKHMPRTYLLRPEHGQYLKELQRPIS